MHAHTRHTRLTRTAIAVVAALTAGGAAVGLTGCGPDQPDAAPSASGSSGPSTTSAPTPETHSAGLAASASFAAGTANTGLTISDGTRYVVIGGTRVDFGTPVRDLAWAPDGSRAAFVDGAGDLVVSAPNGSHRTVVAKNPGKVTWSHPTWQVAAADKRDGLRAKDNLIFTAGSGGTARLMTVPATDVDGTPARAGLNNAPGTHALPQTGNVWPYAAGPAGTAVYANTASGEVYIRDDNLRQQGGVVAKGSEPALNEQAAGGESVVFVRAVDGHDHLFAEQSGAKGWTSPRDLTPHATTDYTMPAFSPDGRTIAAHTPAGTVTLPADGSAAPTRVSTVTGLPAYR